MNTGRMLLMPWCAAACLLFLFCTGQKQQRTAVFLIGSDTVFVDDVLNITPDTVVASDAKNRYCLLWVTAQQAPAPNDDAAFQEAAGDLADLLSRETGRAWTTIAASAIYRAARVVRNRLEPDRGVERLTSFLQELAGGIVILPEQNSCVVTIGVSAAAASDMGDQELLAMLLAALFYPEPRVGEIVASFMYAEDAEVRDTAGIRDLVKGLIFDSAATVKKKARRRENGRETAEDNSARALTYRTHESIQKTIGIHVPNIKALYKKELRIDPAMSGVVYITFRVAASGAVLSARIKSTEIHNRAFTNPLLEYVARMQFQSIPENVGAMTFDFPFEFRPES